MCPLFCGLLLAFSLMLLGLAAVPLLPVSSLISDTISHFLPWYPIAAFFLLVTGFVTPVAGPVVVAAGLTILLSVWQLAPLGQATPVADPDRNLTVLQANMLVTNRDMSGLRALIDDAQPDLIAVQEANAATGRLFRELEADYPHQYASLQDQHSFGMAVASRQPLIGIEQLAFARPHMPAFRFRQKIAGREVDVVTVHPANPLKDFPARRDDYAALANYLEEQGEMPRIVLGDFNATPFSADYQAFTRRLALHNARDMHGIARHYTLGTWPAWLPAFLRLSIDHALCTPELRATFHAIPGETGSDHLPLLTTFAWK